MLSNISIYSTVLVFATIVPFQFTYTIFLALFFHVVGGSVYTSSRKPPFKNVDLTLIQRINQLLKQLNRWLVKCSSHIQEQTLRCSLLQTFVYIYIHLLQSCFVFSYFSLSFNLVLYAYLTPMGLCLRWQINKIPCFLLCYGSNFVLQGFHPLLLGDCCWQSNWINISNQ